MRSNKLQTWIRRLFSGNRKIEPPGEAAEACAAHASTASGKETYYLSLEYLFDGTSYWLATAADGSHLRHFITFPESAFGGRPLHPGKLCWEGGNSELLLFGENGDGARFCSVDEQNPETVDLGAFERLTWNGMCEHALLRRIPVEDCVGLYHPHVVRLRDGTAPLCLYGSKPLPMEDVDYFVSGLLPDEGTLSLMGENHNPPETQNWKGLNALDTPERMREVLIQFRVQAIQLGGHYLKVE